MCLLFSGIDFNSMMSLGQTLSEHEDVARRCKILKSLIHKYQDSITSLEKVSSDLRIIYIYFV